MGPTPHLRSTPGAARPLRTVCSTTFERDLGDQGVVVDVRAGRVRRIDDLHVDRRGDDGDRQPLRGRRLVERLLRPRQRTTW